MAIPVECRACGARYNLKDELAGTNVRCPECQAVIAVPRAPTEAERPQFADDLPDAFRRDRFLLRQKHMAISQKYHVWDEQGNVIVYIERPTYLARGCLAFLVGLVAFMAVGIIGGILGAVLAAGNDVLIGTITVVTILAAVVALVTVLVALYPKRHISLYADESKQNLLLEILQDQKLQLVVGTFTVRDPNGNVLGTFRKNYIHNIWRKRWDGFDPTGQPSVVAREDSLLLSLLRRFIGPLFGILRTNFVILRAGEAGDGELIGEFNRKWTLLDRYVLDMSADRHRVLDRRLALALGVLLDTGERR